MAEQKQNTDSRARMDRLQAEIHDTRGFERLWDAIYSCIDSYADEVSADTGLPHTFVHIALQELVGTVDRYTAEEIDIEVEDLADYE
jgi:hypothetical protein